MNGRPANEGPAFQTPTLHSSKANLVPIETVRRLRDVEVTLARKCWDKAFEYHLKGKSDRAIAAGRKAMELNPRYGLSHWLIGYAFLHREPPDRESAIKEFRQLVEKDPRWCEGQPAGSCGAAVELSPRRSLARVTMYLTHAGATRSVARE
jgi:tetratricopeptide (TPR) repeat protein